VLACTLGLSVQHATHVGVHIAGRFAVASTHLPHSGYEASFSDEANVAWRWQTWCEVQLVDVSVLGVRLSDEGLGSRLLHDDDS
jgi:hypothetical protein